jgi:hypothetical protein
MPKRRNAAGNGVAWVAMAAMLHRDYSGRIHLFRAQADKPIARGVVPCGVVSS